MRRVSIVIALLGLVACTTAFARGGHAVTAFRLPDASAACHVVGGTLECANLRVRSGLVLPGKGTPKAIDARVWWDASTPVLKQWRHGALRCSNAAGSIVCRNASGAAISLDGAHIAVAL
jgi:hypothetical protein